MKRGEVLQVCFFPRERESETDRDKRRDEGRRPFFFNKKFCEMGVVSFINDKVIESWTDTHTHKIGRESMCMFCKCLNALRFLWQLIK